VLLSSSLSNILYSSNVLKIIPTPEACSLLFFYTRAYKYCNVDQWSHAGSSQQNMDISDTITIDNDFFFTVLEATEITTLEIIVLY
jgi:hypothetical protein